VTQYRITSIQRDLVEDGAAALTVTLQPVSATPSGQARPLVAAMPWAQAARPVTLSGLTEADLGGSTLGSVVTLPITPASTAPTTPTGNGGGRPT
jgi:hypothetical protein